MTVLTNKKSNLHSNVTKLAQVRINIKHHKVHPGVQQMHLNNLPKVVITQGRDLPKVVTYPGSDLPKVVT